jgi:uncharacterized protein YcaQ
MPKRAPAVPASPALQISPATARRAAITRQRLAGPRPAADHDGIIEVARDLRALQLDPINVVARSHTLVLWSRLGAYQSADLQTVLYQDKHLFEYWAHCASLVLTEDYPIHRMMMRDRLEGQSPWEMRSREWMAANAEMVDYVRDRLRAEGPLQLNAFEDRAVQSWQSTGWTSGRNVARVIDHLWLRGEIVVVGRNGIHRLWGLADDHLPHWTPRDEWETHQVVRQAAQHALRSLGVAKAAHISNHFTRGRYPGLAAALAEMEADQTIARVQIGDGTGPFSGVWYAHSADLPLLERLERGDDWQPRTVLLSPFDNLICDRKRTQALFGFDFTMEIYVPKEKRRWGYYVLPVLHGDRLIGRIDPAVDRARGILNIHAVHAEPDAPLTAATGHAIGSTLGHLAKFVGAREIAYTGGSETRGPAKWKVG